ncbi:hypothetical protein Tco_0452379 [Tanacetum coccineum]
MVFSPKGSLLASEVTLGVAVLGGWSSSNALGYSTFCCVLKFEGVSSTLRIHSIHPSTQILGDPKSAVQTRSKVNKSSGAHAFVRRTAAIQDSESLDSCRFALWEEGNWDKIERKYPLTKETLERMLSLRLVARTTSEDAYTLLRFIQKHIDEYGSHDGVQTASGKEFSNPLIANSLLKTIWFSTHHASHQEISQNKLSELAENKQSRTKNKQWYSLARARDHNPRPQLKTIVETPETVPTATETPTIVEQRGDCIASFKRRRQDFHGDDFMDLTTASGRSRPKPALEDSTWRRRHDYNMTPS